MQNIGSFGHSTYMAVVFKGVGAGKRLSKRRLADRWVQSIVVVVVSPQQQASSTLVSYCMQSSRWCVVKLAPGPPFSWTSGGSGRAGYICLSFFPFFIFDSPKNLKNYKYVCLFSPWGKRKKKRTVVVVVDLLLAHIKLLCV